MSTKLKDSIPETASETIREKVTCMHAEIVHQPIETYSSVTTMTVEEKGLSLRGYMRILLIAVLIIALSIASTIVSFLRIISYGWQSDLVGIPAEEFWEVAITQHGFPFGWYAIIRYTLGGQLETETFEFRSEVFIIDTIIYIIVYSVIATFILWGHRKGMHAKLLTKRWK